MVGKGRRPEFPSFKPVTFGNSRILETAILDQLGIQSTVTSMVYLFEKNAVHRFRHSVSPFSKVDLDTARVTFSGIPRSARRQDDRQYGEYLFHVLLLKGITRRSYGRLSFFMQGYYISALMRSTVNDHGSNV